MPKSQNVEWRDIGIGQVSCTKGPWRFGTLQMVASNEWLTFHAQKSPENIQNTASGQVGVLGEAWVGIDWPWEGLLKRQANPRVC